MFPHRFAPLVIAFLQGVLVCIASAQSESAPEKPTTADPSGTWKWDYSFDGNTIDAKLKLDWDGKKLKGKYTAFDNTTVIEDTKLEKDEVSFRTLRELNGNEFEVSFKGKVKRDEIVGTVTVDFGEPRDFEWNAKRAVEPDDVLGVWDLRLETPNGVVEPRLTITKAESGLHGEYVSVFGEREAKNLKLKDNELTWEISGENNGMEFKVLYKGKPRGNKIEGTNEFDFGGNTGTMEFTGKRTLPDEKKKERPAEVKPAEAASEAAAAESAEPAATATEAEPATPAAADE